MLQTVDGYTYKSYFVSICGPKGLDFTSDASTKVNTNTEKRKHNVVCVLCILQSSVNTQQSSFCSQLNYKWEVICSTVKFR